MIKKEDVTYIKVQLDMLNRMIRQIAHNSGRGRETVQRLTLARTLSATLESTLTHLLLGMYEEGVPACKDVQDEILRHADNLSQLNVGDEHLRSVEFAEQFLRKHVPATVGKKNNKRAGGGKLLGTEADWLDNTGDRR